MPGPDLARKKAIHPGIQLTRSGHGLCDRLVPIHYQFEHGSIASIEPTSDIVTDEFGCDAGRQRVHLWLLQRSTTGKLTGD
jgi:hypothetical protein